MSMISLKNSPKEKKKQGGLVVNGSDYDDYPWGLRLDLNDDTMKKLGLTTKDFETGTVITLTAKAKVKETRTTERNGKEDQSLELQITHLDIDGKAKESKGKKHMKMLNDGPGGSAM